MKDDQEAEDVFIIESNKVHGHGTGQDKRKKEKKERKTYKLEISFTLADTEYFLLNICCLKKTKHF